MVLETPQYLVDGIEQVASHHRDLVDDQHVERPHDVDLVLRELKLVVVLRQQARC